MSNRPTPLTSIPPREADDNQLNDDQVDDNENDTSPLVASPSTDPTQYNKEIIRQFNPDDDIDEPPSPLSRNEVSPLAKVARIVGVIALVVVTAIVIAVTWHDAPNVPKKSANTTNGTSNNSSNNNNHHEGHETQAPAPPPPAPTTASPAPRCLSAESTAVSDAVQRLLQPVGADKSVTVNICVLDPNSADFAQLKQDAGIVSSSKRKSSDDRSSPSYLDVAGTDDAFAVTVKGDNKSNNNNLLMITITVEATTAVAAGSGFYWAAKNVLGIQVTWGADGSGDQLATIADPSKLFFGSPSSSSLPSLTRTVLKSTVPLRWAWNMCTFSYAAAFWDWKRWQRELDWMLFHGINLPLAFVGQEYVWMKLFKDEYGVGLSDLQTWFVGPAFLAWQRAGNIRGFAGPLPGEWIEQQYQLQLKILQRMRDFNMKPVLPCFGGHVPRIVKTKLYPNATYQRSTPWNKFGYEFSGDYMLDPTDPVFELIGTKFVSKVIEIYGNKQQSNNNNNNKNDENPNNYYSCDTFNENDPVSTDLSYLKAASKSVVDSIAASDANGVWVMQAWLFSPWFHYWGDHPDRVEAYLSGAPVNKLLMLDLHSENGVLAWTYSSYYGHAFIWCLLHNYGGRHGMYGSLALTASAPFTALARTGTNTMIGMGFTPEDIEVGNNVVYELLTENFFALSTTGAADTIDVGVKTWQQQYLPGSTSQFNVTAWLDRFLGQRYAVALNLNSGPKSKSSSSDSDEQQPSRIISPLLISEHNSNIWTAWNLMLGDLYNQWCDPVTELERKPVLDVDASDLQYSQCGTPAIVRKAWQLLAGEIRSSSNNGDGGLSATGRFSSGPLQYDLVDFTRQIAVMFFADTHQVMLDVAYLSSGFNVSYFNKSADTLLAIILSLDDLYSRDNNWLFGRWLQRAVADVPASVPAKSAEREQMENQFWYNAKNQVTLWGPTGQISDYAMKPWQGLYKDYYHMRWKLGLDTLRSAGGGNNANLVEFKQTLLEAMIAWCNQSRSSDDNNNNEKYVTSANPFKTPSEVATAMQNFESLISVPQLQLDANYEIIPVGESVVGMTVENRYAMWTADPQQLAKLCDMHPHCVGFSHDPYGAATGALYSSFVGSSQTTAVPLYRRRTR